MAESILETDLGAPREQCHIAKLIYIRTVDECDYTDSSPPCKGSSESPGLLG